MSGTDLTQEAAFLPHLMNRRRLIAAVGGVASLSAIGMRAYGQEAIADTVREPGRSPRPARLEHRSAHRWPRRRRLPSRRR